MKCLANDSVRDCVGPLGQALTNSTRFGMGTSLYSGWVSGYVWYCDGRGGDVGEKGLEKIVDEDDDFSLLRWIILVMWRKTFVK